MIGLSNLARSTIARPLRCSSPRRSSDEPPGDQRAGLLAVVSELFVDRGVVGFLVTIERSISHLGRQFVALFESPGRQSSGVCA